MLDIRGIMIEGNKPFLAIIGPTASGKTAISLDIAHQINGEIICADSRTIYKYMDIGTAKPTRSERQAVKHHLLDVIEPNEILSAARFRRLAEAAAIEIWARGHVPIMVGGSGLYIDSVLYSFDFPPPPPPSLRSELNDLPLPELVQRLHAADPERASKLDLHNKRRVVRALETLDVGSGQRQALLPGSFVIGMSLNKDIARKRITSRVEKMLSQGFIEEVERIGTMYGWDSPAMNVIGYRAFKPVVLGEVSEQVGKHNFVQGDMALFKKQQTWFKRNEDVVWVDNAHEVADEVIRYMARWQV